MAESEKVCDMLGIFNDASTIFRKLYQEPFWRKYSANLADPREAASMFLEGYGFERQGRNPSFSPAAVDAIKKSVVASGFPHTVYKEFSNLLDNKGLNPKNNPLYHPCWMTCPISIPLNSCGCIWCVLGEDNIVLISKKDLENGQIRKALDRLRKIRGIGNKIASFFLRDLVIEYDLGDSIPYQDRWLLQPIDVWVRRIVRSLSEPSMNDEKIAEWIVDVCKEANQNPEQCNQGMWYFGAKIVGSDYKWRKSLEDINYAKSALSEHLTVLKSMTTVEC